MNSPNQKKGKAGCNAFDSQSPWPFSFSTIAQMLVHRRHTRSLPLPLSFFSYFIYSRASHVKQAPNNSVVIQVFTIQLLHTCTEHELLEESTLLGPQILKCFFKNSLKNTCSAFSRRFGSSIHALVTEILQSQFRDLR